MSFVFSKSAKFEICVILGACFAHIYERIISCKAFIYVDLKLTLKKCIILQTMEISF